MTQVRATVVPIALSPHPNADSLSLVKVGGYTVCARTADWEEKQTGVYIPVDAIVPDRPEFAFLDGHFRIKARKLRGIFSEGLLVPADPSWAVGQDVTEFFELRKYEPPEPTGPLRAIAAPSVAGGARQYTDIERLKANLDVFSPDEMVVATEKIHGANARYALVDGILYAGSHRQWLEDAKLIEMPRDDYKTEHGRIEGLDQIVINILDCCEDVRRVIPGRIYVKKGRSLPPALKVKYDTSSGLKCLYTIGRNTQEVFLICSDSKKARAWVLREIKIAIEEDKEVEL